MSISPYSLSFWIFEKMFFLVQIKTLTLEPSFIGLIITGKVNFEFINFKKIFFLIFYCVKTLNILELEFYF